MTIKVNLLSLRLRERTEVRVPSSPYEDIEKSLIPLSLFPPEKAFSRLNSMPTPIPERAVICNASKVSLITCNINLF
jgi:hypothetical protein